MRTGTNRFTVGPRYHEILLLRLDAANEARRTPPEVHYRVSVRFVTSVDVGIAVTRNGDVGDRHPLVRVSDLCSRRHMRAHEIIGAACGIASCGTYVPVPGSDAGSVGSDSGGSDGSSSVSKKPACQVSTTSCQCTIGSAQAEDVECTKTTIANSRCCADVGYPKSGSCACEVVHCSPVYNNCGCQALGAGTAVSCMGTYCCISETDGTCACGQSDYFCLSGDLRVSSCTTSNLGCTGGRVPVDACSVP